MTYLLFVAVAFVFWCVLSLDNQIQRDFDVPVEFEDVPDSLTLISEPPRSVSVSVKAKGTQLLRFLFGETPTLKIKFDKALTSDNHYTLSRARLESRLREYFGAGVQIVSCRPESFQLTYTTNPGKKVALKVHTDIHPALQYILSGQIRANIDSVRVYSTGDIPRTLEYVETEMITKSDLKDTTRYEVRIKPIEGLRIIPDKVVVTVPVEPLISKKRSIPVETLNVPEGTQLLTFPSKVEISYLVPMSQYSGEYPVKAYVDFDSIHPGRKRLPVTLSATPAFYNNVCLATDSVEFIMESRLK